MWEAQSGDQQNVCYTIKHKHVLTADMMPTAVQKI